MPFLPSRIGAGVAAATFVAVSIAWRLTGGAIFSPGDLRGPGEKPARLGGVASHAELAERCDACHAGPLSAKAMRERCLACHDDIVREIARRDSAAGIHARLDRGEGCTGCHTEHQGASGEITSLAGFRHSATGFPLDGAHARATCAACHGNAARAADYRKAPTECIGCHERDDRHQGEMGRDCGSCHGQETWEGARFDHAAFPINHGGDGAVACRTCHQDPKNYRQYTCYGCHEHSRERVIAEHRGEVRTQNLDQCLECHRGGSKHGERGEGREREEHDEHD